MAEDFTQRATCEAYYKFENAGDLGEDNQNQIDLTNANAATQSADIPSGTYASPSATKSVDLEQTSSQHLYAVHNDSTEIDDLTALTFLCWLKLESKQAWARLAEKGYSDGGWFLMFLSGGDDLRADFGNASYCDWTNAFSLATWMFIAITYSQTSDKFRLYYGEEETQVSMKTENSEVNKSAATAERFTLGANAAGDNEIDGLFCEYTVFSEELSLAELQEVQVDGMEGSVAVAPTGHILGPLYGPLGGPI